MIKYVTKISKSISIEKQWNQLFVVGFKKKWIYKNNLFNYYIYKDSLDSSILNFEFSGAPKGIFSLLIDIPHIGVLHQEMIISRKEIEINVFHKKESQILVFENKGLIFRCLRIGDNYSGTIINSQIQKNKILSYNLKAS